MLNQRSPKKFQKPAATLINAYIYQYITEYLEPSGDPVHLKEYEKVTLFEKHVMEIGKEISRKHVFAECFSPLL